MNKKVWIAGLAGGVAAFFLGWLIWGILLMDFSEANTTVYEGLFKEQMNMVTIFIGCLLWAFTIAWIYYNFSGRKSVQGGAVTGAILGLLIAAMMDYELFGKLESFHTHVPGCGCDRQCGLFRRCRGGGRLDPQG